MSIDQKELLIGTLIGSAIAATAVLLFTPTPGARMRAKVQEFITGGNGATRKVKRSPRRRHPVARAVARAKRVANHAVREAEHVAHSAAHAVSGKSSRGGKNSKQSSKSSHSNHSKSKSES